MNRASIRAGVLAAGGLALLYALVVGGVGGVDQLRQQAASDWPWLVMILAGFGTQVGLYVELRHRRRLHRTVTAAAGAGGTASAVGMVACCAHHVADLAPVIGASGAAVFLTSYRLPIMLAAAGQAVRRHALGGARAARNVQRPGRSPAIVTVTSRRTAALDGRLPAAARALRQ